MSFLRTTFLAAATFVVGSSGVVALAKPATDLGFELPTDPRLWQNSPPLSMESLSGKGVVFYFFEEEDPRIAANWPALLGLTKQYEGKPLLFIAVNSGSDPRVLKRYLTQQRIGWPVILDLDRSLENAMGVPKINPQGEVFAVKYVSGEGSLGTGVGADFAGTAESALKGASWRVDPSVVPPKLMGAWKAVELGDFQAAARTLTQAAESKDEQIKAGADQLLSAVEEEVTEAAKQAQDALAEGDEWTAYKQLESLTQRFEGYEFELIERAESRSKELARSKGVKDQLAAARLLAKAVATGSKGTAGAVNRAKGLLNRIVDDYPASEAATKAQELLATLDR